MLLTVLAATSISTALPSSTEYGKITTTSVVDESTVLAMSGNNVEDIVRSYFHDIPVMVQVARCESAFRHTLPDGTILKGKVDPADTGVMQINKRYHEKAAAAMNLNLDNIYQNMAYARHLYETQGTRPWKASSACWSPTLAMNI